ncbi:MAG: GtrA family protein [Ignavibacteriales bacterium]|nr:GtrA family protein [Ignavibacteriales bacterium]
MQLKPKAKMRLVNMGVLYMLTHLFFMDYKIASICAIEISILSNFFINNYWTWRDKSNGTFVHKLLKYHTTAAISGVINWLLLILFTEQFHLHFMLSNFIGIAIGSVINFLLNNFWTFK